MIELRIAEIDVKITPLPNDNRGVIIDKPAEVVLRLQGRNNEEVLRAASHLEDFGRITIQEAEDLVETAPPDPNEKVIRSELPEEAPHYEKAVENEYYDKEDE